MGRAAYFCLQPVDLIPLTRARNIYELQDRDRRLPSHHLTTTPPFFFSRNVLHILTKEGDESCPVSTLQSNAVRYYHPATSIARTRSSSRCDVMGGCKRSRHLGKSCRDQMSTIYGLYILTTDQTKNDKNR
jgi:hypothetical protein